jgi:hypothetical protein
MRIESISILVMLVGSGCVTQSRDDIIEQVARGLEKIQVQGLTRHEHRIFPSQLCVCLLLPSNTPPAHVASEALKMNPLCSYGSTKVLRVRKVRISSPEYEMVFPDSYEPVFTAVLMDTAVGRRVVLLQYIVPSDRYLIPETGAGYWEHWTIDPDGLINEITGTDAGGPHQ